MNIPEWISPELIVMKRSDPIDSVLGDCKTLVGDPGPDSQNDGCFKTL
jgi:hypothetical protein